MDIQEVIGIVNSMQADGVIDRYAIGGAVGATFYLEPVATLDLNVFVSFESDSAGLLISLQPIYDYLLAKGGAKEGEHIVMSGWPVQFLPPGTPLVAEALAQAVTWPVATSQANVFTAEHLAAIALQTGRPKDKARLLQFLEAGVLDNAKFQDILRRHDLSAVWGKFERQFLAP